MPRHYGMKKPAKKAAKKAAKKPMKKAYGGGKMKRR